MGALDAGPNRGWSMVVRANPTVHPHRVHTHTWPHGQYWKEVQREDLFFQKSFW